MNYMVISFKLYGDDNFGIGIWINGEYFLYGLKSCIIETYHKPSTLVENYLKELNLKIVGYA